MRKLKKMAKMSLLARNMKWLLFITCYLLFTFRFVKRNTVTIQSHYNKTNLKTKNHYFALICNGHPPCMLAQGNMS